MISLAVYFRLFDRLFLNPGSLFPTIFNYKPPHLVDPQIITAISNSLDYCVILILTIAITKNYLTIKGVTDPTFPLIINFSISFLLIILNFQWQSRPIIHFIIFFITIILISESYYWLDHFFHKKIAPYGYIHLGWATLIILLTIGVNMALPLQALQGSYLDFFSSSFFVHFLGIMLVAVLIPILPWLGISIPTEMYNNMTDLIPISTNLNAIYQSVNATVPYPENLYSVFATFSYLGGAGSTLAISIWLLFNQRKKYQKLGWFSIIPSIFNNNQLLLFGLPIMLRPIMLLPMILSSTIGSLIGFTAIKLNILKPAIFNVPMNSPRLLLGFLASQNHWPSLLAVLLVFAVTLLIYQPFLKYVTKEVN
ncbi:PTS system, cellobiose-specific IIC component [Leuconostocaceae bacterium R-53105]|uniref:PTS system cellobiose-specific IIC component n=1 Tax=Convivina intestini TaxID=1505726 RepID=A0A2U1DBG5_9LACO|nr:PTS system cellobiose-specific IIC component [Convivina intestini]CAH1853385.1 hypothetical protein R077811_00681 [Convivina intestini]SDB89425.1 PTS system, cellobiose-specific IIC component [Leuconostocaceae bacterium R-53105]